MYTTCQKAGLQEKGAPHGPTRNILNITQLRILGLVRTRKHK